MTLDEPTKIAVNGLPKGRGVRGDLDTLLFRSRTRLAEMWGITSADREIVRRAKVIYRLWNAFRTLSEERSRQAAPDLYNVRPDREMHHLDLGGRMALFEARHPNGGYSKRTLSRILDTTRREIRNSLLKPLAGIPDGQLQIIVQREEKFADDLAGRVRPESFTRLVQRSYRAPMDDAVDAFLRLPAIVPRSYTDGLIIARTASHGDWLCVFSTDERHLAHQHATQRHPVVGPWSGRYSTMLGTHLVHEVACRWSTVGIVVDPPGTPSTDTRPRTASALRLAPNLISQLADRLRHDEEGDHNGRLLGPAR